MKKIKMSILLAAIAALSLACFCFACNGEPGGGGGGTNLPSGDDGDPEQFVTSITYSGDYKNVYYEGESFDPTGLVVTAVWYDDDVETLTARDYGISPEALAPTDTHVRLTYEDNHVDIPVTVNEIIPTALKIIEYPNQTLFKGEALDIGDLRVSATVASGENIALIPSFYTVKLGENEIDDTIIPETGVHTCNVSFRGKTASFDIAVIDGFAVQAENIIATDDITGSDKNFVEKVNGNYKTAYNKSASDGAYIQDVAAGDDLLFHVWAEKAGKASLVLRASCAGAEPSVNDQNVSNWNIPIGTWSIKMLRSNNSGYMDISVKTAGADAFTAVPANDLIRISGGVSLNEDGSFNPKGDEDLFANWYRNVFAEIDLAEGDNIVKLHMYGRLNIDCLEVRYIPDDHDCSTVAMTHKTHVDPVCGGYGIKEHYICPVCTAMYADSEATNRLYDTQIEMTGSHDYVLTADGNYKQDYYESEMFDTENLTVHGKCSVCRKYSDLTSDIHIEKSTLSVDMNDVVLTAGGAQLKLSVTVKAITPTAVEISGAPELSQYKGQKIDLSGLTVTAVTDDNKKFVLGPDAYKIKLGDNEFDTNETIDSDMGVYDFSVVYKTVTKNCGKVAVLESIFVEGENVYKTADIPQGAVNYFEDSDGDTAQKRDNTNAHGGTYLSGMNAGKLYKFHIYSEEQRQVELILHAARDQMGASGSKGPYQTWDVDLFSWADFYAAGSDKESLNVSGSNGMKLSAVISRNADGTFNPEGDPDLWTKWQSINFGTVTLKPGDNTVVFRVTRQMSIDCLEVRYSLAHTHCADIMYHEKGCEATQVSQYGILEYYDCAVCAKKYSDANGTTELKCTSYQYSAPAASAESDGIPNAQAACEPYITDKSKKNYSAEA